MPLPIKRRVGHLSVFIAAAASLQAIEGLVPHPIPWLRLGLANAITLISLIIYGVGAALSVAVGRIFLASLISGSFLSPTFYLSLSGGLFSAIIMVALYKPFGIFSPIGVSILGGVSHNIAQLFTAYYLMVGHSAIFSLLPFLVVAGSISGFLNGYIVKIVTLRLADYSDLIIYLGSSSPRREKIFVDAGVPFISVPPESEEPRPNNNEGAPEYAIRASEYKLNSIVEKVNGPGIIVTADTVVECEGIILGKPSSFEEAYEMLSLLSDNVQRVYTAITAFNMITRKKISEVTVSELKLKKISEEGKVFLSEKHLDKAGAYGIQDMKDEYLEWMKGSFSNVVGLPVKTMRRIIKNIRN